MKELFFNTIQEFNDFIGVKTLHPLVSIARVERTAPIQEAVHYYGLYALFLKENKGCKLSTQSRSTDCQIYGIGFPSRVAQPHPAWQEHLPL